MIDIEPLYRVRASRLAVGNDGQGKSYCAFVSVTRAGSSLRVAPLQDRARGTILVSGAPAILEVCLSCDKDGGLVAIWNEIAPGGGAVLRFAVQKAQGTWTTPAALCTLPGSCLAPAAARDETGRPWCAFHSNALGKHHIFVSWYEGHQWSFPLRISDGDGHCFAPTICPFNSGVRVAWDACVDGAFGIYMRQVAAESLVKRQHPQTTVTEGEHLVANPAIATIDGVINLVVWERGRAGWGGRNSVPRGRPAAEMFEENFLRGRRELAGAIIGPTGMAPLSNDLEQALHPQSRGGSRARPSIAQNAAGTIWLTWRQLEKDYDGPARQGFRLLASRYDGGRWQEAVELPDSGATADAQSVIAPGPEGGPVVGFIQQDGSKRWARIVSLKPSGAAKAGDKTTAYPAAGPFAPMRVPRFREPTVPAHPTLDGSFGSPVLLWGDLHRHSDVSPCWWKVEGTLLDTYRYALGVAQLDFLAVTDHRSDLVAPDAAAQTEGLANGYDLPGIFTAFVACEINTDGQGHMVVLTDRDRLDVPYLRNRSALYKRLDPRHHVVIPHHPGDPAHLYSWGGHDEKLSPVAEVYQAYRTTFEAIDAPAPATTWVRPGRGPQPGHTLLDAWQSGLHLGVVASSDHLSTGGALAGVWAMGNNRRDILEALRARRCYAATDRIRLLFHADGHFMGERFRAAGEKVQFEISCRGAAAIVKAELLCDGQVVHVAEPRKRSASLRIRHRLAIAAGEHFYTVRVYQQGDHMAWSSPIWITRR